MSKKSNVTGLVSTMRNFINELLYSNIGKLYTYKDLVSEYLKLNKREVTEKDIEEISDCGDYKNELLAARKAILDIKEHFEGRHCGNFFIIAKDGRTCKFGYSKDIDFNPLEFYSTQYHQMRRKALEELLMHSNGIISKNILCKTGIGKKEREIIHFDSSEDLKNVGLVSDFYFDILEQKVVHFSYVNFYGSKKEVTLSPHYLKSYQGRWYVMGYTEEERNARNIYAIDRVSSFVEDVRGKEWHAPEDNCDYEKFYEDIIGVTHPRDKKNNYSLYPKTEIIFETLDPRTHGLIKTQKIHNSQQILREYNLDTNEPGIVKLNLRTNQEFIEILSKFSVTYKQPGIKILSPKSLADFMVEKAKKIIELYQ